MEAYMTNTIDTFVQIQRNQTRWCRVINKHTREVVGSVRVKVLEKRGESVRVMMLDGAKQRTLWVQSRYIGDITS